MKGMKRFGEFPTFILEFLYYLQSNVIDIFIIKAYSTISIY